MFRVMSLKNAKLTIRHSLRSLTNPVRLTTSSVRSLPDFIIIGGMKCASTSLWYYLKQHPNVLTANKKEVNFFDSNLNYSKGINWYRSHFPVSKNFLSAINLNKLIIGEATPSYVFCPRALRRIAEILPDAKLIVLLRNPVDRAYSHYRHLVRSGRESLSFEEAIKKEIKIKNQLEIVKDKSVRNYEHVTYSYLQRGIYVDQLKLWFSFFSKSQLLILKTEDLASNPSKSYKKVLNFLELPHWEPQQYEKLNSDSGKNPKKSSCAEFLVMNEVTRAKLVDFFEPYNQSLYEYLETNFAWS